MKNNFLSYHIVSISPWPMLGGLSALSLTMSMVSLFKWGMKYNFFFYMSIIFIMMVMFFWWKDVLKEGSKEGFHSNNVIQGLKLGMSWFIFSEIMFFFGFFWAFFHHSLNPDIQIGCIWPPFKLNPLNPFLLPLLNTVILLSSGVSATWAHHSLLLNKKNLFSKMMIFTILLGVMFMYIQSWEYKWASYSFFDSIYGSSFFMATGFHGLHVTIGILFMTIMLLRSASMTMWHHIGLELSLWYWHFVDVVWLFLFMVIYWWGG